MGSPPSPGYTGVTERRPQSPERSDKRSQDFVAGAMSRSITSIH